MYNVLVYKKIDRSGHPGAKNGVLNTNEIPSIIIIMVFLEEKTEAHFVAPN